MGCIHVGAERVISVGSIVSRKQSFVYHFTSIEDSYFCIAYLFLKKLIELKSRKNSKGNVVKFISILRRLTIVFRFSSTLTFDRLKKAK